MTDIRKFLPLILLGVLLLLVFNMCGSYNTSLRKEEKVQESWAQVETQYQRRANLIPNLVNTVQGYADFEKQTLEAVVQARANATSMQLKVEDLTPENIQRFEQAQSALGGALDRLLVTVERYPDLKASAGFLDLQNQLEGSENRIAVEIRNFNQAVNDYNTYVRRFPTKLFAGMFGFSPKGYFSAAPGSEKAPEVRFPSAK